jgi:hypothetical protein
MTLLMHNFVNTATVETSRLLVLFIMKLHSLIIKKNIYMMYCSLFMHVSVKKSLDNNYNNHHGDYLLTTS